MGAPVRPHVAEPRTRRPAAALRPYLSSYIGYHLEPQPPSVHQGVASGHLTLLLCLDGTLRLLANADRSKPPGTFVAMASGLHNGPAEIGMGERQTGLQLQLTWRGARALLGLPAAELAGDTVDLAALLGRRTDTLLDRLATATTWAQRFDLLDVELQAMADAGRADLGGCVPRSATPGTGCSAPAATCGSPSWPTRSAGAAGTSPRSSTPRRA
jgi:hypothetical protein